MFIDIHVHTRKIPGPPRLDGRQSYATPEQLIERYDKLGIEMAVLLPGVSPECSLVPQSNQEIGEICKEYPDRFIPFCNVDPRAVSNSVDAPLDHLLGYYKDQGFKGVGEVTANLPISDPKVQNLFRHAEKAGLPLTFHLSGQIGNTYGLYDDPGLPQLEQSLKKFPRLKFLAHSQVFWAEMGRLKTTADRFGYPNYPIDEEGVVPVLFRRYENLYGDLSAGSGYNALARDKKYAVEFLNEFQDRLMFGTDICAPDTPAPLVDFLLEIREENLISETVFQKVARENARKLLGL
ncbi:MAG: amidohydrolase family protein [Caldicoprobacterales bacterium]|jgi:predicted TIM-barrel fold metal-dependent hydrolase|nr:amidohydrolase [Clostridiales bacterium]